MLARLLSLAFTLIGTLILSTDAAVAVGARQTLDGSRPSPASLSPALPTRCQQTALRTEFHVPSDRAKASRLSTVLSEMPTGSLAAALKELDPRRGTGLRVEDLVEWREAASPELLSRSSKLAQVPSGGDDDGEYVPCETSPAKGSDACYQGFLCATFQCTKSDGSSGSCRQPAPTIQMNPLWLWCPNFTLKTYRCVQGCAPFSVWPVLLGLLASWLAVGRFRL